MNTSLSEGIALAKAISETSIPEDVEVVMSVPFTHLNTIVKEVSSNPKIAIAAQNCADKASGAYTGEISVSMINSVGATHVLIGHSERRSYYAEDAAVLNAKLNLALEAGLTPIYCCGEPLEIRKAGTHVAYVKQQLEATIFQLSENNMKRLVLAYEPIWAIGTGETASPEQAEEMHASIRSLLTNKFGTDIAESTSILYGGSVKPANAKEIFSQANVDGGLVGGASLKSDSFIEIIHSF